jgi:hypothetical protein
MTDAPQRIPDDVLALQQYDQIRTHVHHMVGAAKDHALQCTEKITPCPGRGLVHLLDGYDKETLVALLSVVIGMEAREIPLWTDHQ